MHFIYLVKNNEIILYYFSLLAARFFFRCSCFKERSFHQLLFSFTVSWVCKYVTWYNFSFSNSYYCWQAKSLIYLAMELLLLHQLIRCSSRLSYVALYLTLIRYFSKYQSNLSLTLGHFFLFRWKWIVSDCIKCGSECITAREWWD